jgi:hypothetical protein
MAMKKAPKKAAPKESGSDRGAKAKANAAEKASIKADVKYMRAIKEGREAEKQYGFNLRTGRPRFSRTSDGIMSDYAPGRNENINKGLYGSNDLAGRRGTKNVPNSMNPKTTTRAVRGRTAQRAIDQEKRAKEKAKVVRRNTAASARLTAQAKGKKKK